MVRKAYDSKKNTSAAMAATKQVPGSRSQQLYRLDLRLSLPFPLPFLRRVAPAMSAAPPLDTGRWSAAVSPWPPPMARDVEGRSRISVSVAVAASILPLQKQSAEAQVFNSRHGRHYGEC